MSAIYGYINLDGRPVDPSIPERMKKAMSYCGPDGQFEWAEGPCCLGQMHLWNTPESLREKYPLIDEELGIVFMAACRIDNRDDLFNALSIHHSERAPMTDGELMFHAYRKWGKEACDRMLGDWSFVAYHKRENKLFVARDHCGIMACYYYQGKNFFAFSSTLKGVLALSNIIPKELNEFRIAQILVAWPGDGEQTCYQNIFNLKPGCFLEIGKVGVRKTQFWELTEQPDLILPKEQDYYDRFLEIFTEAVRCRLRSYKNIGISLSGGLDSTSIAAIAAIELAKQNKELYAFTSVPYYKDYKVSRNRNGDEGPLAAEMAKMYPNIRHTLVDARGYSVIDSIKKGVKIFSEPILSTGNLFWLNAIAHSAKENNVGLLLTGQGGNSTISWPTRPIQVYYSELNASIYRVVYRRFKKYYSYLAKDRYIDFTEVLLASNKIHFSEHQMKMKDKLENQKKASNRGRYISLKQDQRNFIKNLSGNSLNLHYSKGSYFNINSVDPTFDYRQITFSMTIPEKVYFKNSYNRIFIFNTISNLLPKEILLSKTRGFQGADLTRRLYYEKIQFDELFSNIDPNNEFLKSIISFVNESGIFQSISKDFVGRNELLFIRIIAIINFFYTLSINDLNHEKRFQQTIEGQMEQA